VSLRVLLPPSPSRAQFLSHAERFWLQMRQDDARSLAAASKATSSWQRATSECRRHARLRLVGSGKPPLPFRSGPASAPLGIPTMPAGRTAAPSSSSPAEVVADWRMVYLGVVWMLIACSMYGLIFFIPLLISSMFHEEGPGHDPCSGECAAGPGRPCTCALIRTCTRTCTCTPAPAHLHPHRAPAPRVAGRAPWPCVRAALQAAPAMAGAASRPC
jgi:hypothetical protein